MHPTSLPSLLIFTPPCCAGHVCTASLLGRTNTADPVVFTLTPPECFMEIRSGYGLTGNRINGPVHVGDPVTLAIYMRSQWDGFDILVNDCFAHNGANKKIQLIDHHG